MKNLSAPEFGLASCQASLFTPDADVTVGQLLRELLPRWLQRFDDEPKIQQEPGVPQPRVLLQSVTGMWRCEISAGRIDLYWLHLVPSAPKLALGDFYAVAAEMLGEYAQLTRCRVGRLAAVLNRTAGHEAPGLFLSRHFLQQRWTDGPLSRTEFFELHSHKRYALGGRFLVNSWMRCRTVPEEGGARPVVLLEQDLNTLAEEAASRQFTVQELTDFFTLAGREFDGVLSLYYPPPG